MDVRDSDTAGSLVESILESIDDAGLSPEQGLSVGVEAIICLAEKTSDPNRALDEVGEMLGEVTLLEGGTL